MVESETPIGIIIPPLDIRNIVNKTAQFVARNGPEFEVRIRKNEQNNVKFNFLKDDDPYNSFYRHRVAAFKSGKAQEEEAAKKEEEAKKAREKQEEMDKAENLKTDEKGNRIGGADQTFLNNEPPPKFEFIVDPPSLNAKELDLIKLTAQFVAKNGRSFLTDLMHKEAKNYQFDFLRPQHSLFVYFTTLVEQYTKILIPSRALLNTIERDAHPMNASLVDYKKDLKYRVDWTRSQRKIQKEEQEELERDKLQYNQIDWHDFVIVETIDYQQSEALTNPESFPAPVTVEELGKRLTQQLRYEEFGEDGIKQQLEDERALKEEEEARKAEMEEARRIALEAEREALEAAAEIEEEELRLQELEAQEEQKRLEELGKLEQEEEFEHLDPTRNLPAPSFVEPNAVKIVKDYDPKAQKRIVNKVTNSEKWLISPLTGEKIRADKVEKHMAHGLLDPTYVEMRKNKTIEKQSAGGIYASNKDISSSLQNLAARRTDIFGIDETYIGQKVSESIADVEKRLSEQKTWDGHAGSAELVTARAKKVSVQQQYNELQKMKDAMAEGKEMSELLNPGEIGPKTGGSFLEPEAPKSIAAQGKHPPPPPSKKFDAAAELSKQSPMEAQYEVVPHVVLNPALLSQKLPSGKPGKRGAPIENMTLEEKIRNEEAEDLETPAMLAAADVHKETNYAGLSETLPKKAKIMEKLKLSDTDFIAKYAPDNKPKLFIVQVPANDQFQLENQRLEFALDLKTNVAEIKQKLENKLKVPFTKQKIQYDGKFLKDAVTLAEANVLPESFIVLNIKERDGMKEKCQSFACAIQVCLQRWNNNADRCQETIQKHINCCIETSVDGKTDQANCSGYQHAIDKHFSEK